MEKTQPTRMSAHLPNPVKGARNLLAKIATKCLGIGVATVEKLAITKLDKVVDPKDYPELHIAAHEVLSVGTRLAANQVGVEVASKLKARRPSSVEMPTRLPINGAVMKQGAHCFGSQAHTWLQHNQYGGIEGAIDLGMETGAALAKEQINELVDPRHYPHLSQALISLTEQSKELASTVLGQAVSEFLGIPSASQNPTTTPSVTLSDEIFEELSVFVARHAQTKLAPHIEQGLHHLIDRLYSRETIDFRNELKAKASATIHEAAAGAAQYLEERTVMRSFMRGQNIALPPSVFSVIGAGANAWLIGDVMGPAVQFAPTTSQASAAELGVRATGALVAGVVGERSITAFGTEVAVALIPTNIHESKANQALTNQLQRLSLPLYIGSDAIDHLISLSDESKAALFQTTTTIGYTALSQGGTFAPLVTTRFVSIVGRMGSTLGLVDDKHFTTENMSLKELAAQCVIGYGTMTAAETARAHLGNEAAMLVYFAGNTLASPAVMRRIARSDAPKRIGHGLVDLSAWALKKTLLKQPAPASETPPSTLKRFVAWVMAPVENEEDLWV